MAKAPDASRAPRGTRILAKAFFTAADDIPEPRRAEVIKAALVVIRDELRTTRAQIALAKARRTTGGAPRGGSARKAADNAKGPVKSARTAGSARPKSPAKRDRKALSRPAEPAMSVDTDEPSEL